MFQSQRLLSEIIVQDKTWKSNCILLKSIDVITYSCINLNDSIASEMQSMSCFGTRHDYKHYCSLNIFQMLK